MVLRNRRTQAEIAFEFVDRLGCMCVAVDSRNVVVYASAAAVAALHVRAGERLPQAQPWPRVASLGRTLRERDGQQSVRLVGDPGWRARLWRMPDGLLAIKLDHDVARPAATAVLSARLGLGPHEARLARLVAAGLPNVEIAERLRVSEGSIKMRLLRLCRRLGVANRRALAARVAAVSH